MSDLLLFNDDDSEQSYGAKLRFIIFLTLGAIAIFFIMMLITFRGKPKTTIPNVVGSPLTSAMMDLQKAGIVTQIVISYDNVDAGSSGSAVLSQTPTAGLVTKEGRHVTLTVSAPAAQSSLTSQQQTTQTTDHA